MKVTTSVTRVELDCDERDILRKAIEILENVNGVVGNNSNINYVVDDTDMDLYDGIYDEIGRIEDWVTRE